LKFFLSILYIWWVSTVFSQQLHFNSFTTEDGLSQNSVYSIAQTKEGFMWFGTQDGLNRYDGETFTTYHPNYFNKKEIYVNNMITSLYVDSNDIFWVGTGSELLIYDRYVNNWYLPESKFKNFILPEETWVKKILPIKNKIWVATQNQGLLYYDKELKKTVKVSNKLTDIVSICPDPSTKIMYVITRNTVYSLLNDQLHDLGYKGKNDITDALLINGKLWLTLNEASIEILSIDNGKIISNLKFYERYNGPCMMKDPKIIFQKDTNEVWIGSRSDGIIQVDLIKKKFQCSHSEKIGIETLNKRFILSIFEDKQKNIWVGLSGGGVALLNRNNQNIQKWSNIDHTQNTQPDNMVYSLYKYNSDVMMCGTAIGGVYFKNLNTNSFQYYRPAKSINNNSEHNNIYSIQKGNQNIYWLSAKGGVMSFDISTYQFKLYFDPDDIQTTEICSMIKLKNRDSLLTASYNGELRIFNIKTKKFEKINYSDNNTYRYEIRARYLMETDKGDVFMSTETKNFCILNYLNGSFTTFPQFLEISSASRHFNVEGNYLWVATDNGLIQADKINKKIIKVWTKKDGISNNYIYSILLDRNNILWVATNFGLNSINLNSNVVKKITDLSRLQSLEFNTAAALKDNEDNLWFGGISGFNKISSALEGKSSDYSKLLITKLEVMNKDFASRVQIPYISNIELPYHQNFINIQFRFLDYSESDNVVYEYKMSNIDTAWVRIADRNYASYTQMKPGNYKFKVRAILNNQTYDEKQMNININPSWYNSWWFYLLTTILLSSAIIYLIRLKINNFKFKLQLHQQMIKSELETLKLQMNPHFIFNSLNSINSFIVENKTNLASDYLTKFSRLIRLILDNSKNETITLENELETLKLYLLMESLRFNQSFEYCINIDNNIDASEISIPPLIIQPYVENAIWHGLMHKTHDRLLIINIKRVSIEDIIIEIIDNGVGREKAASLRSKSVNLNKSYGLEITKQRLVSLNKRNTITIIDLFDAYQLPIGTKVILKLYQINKYESSNH